MNLSQVNMKHVLGAGVALFGLGLFALRQMGGASGAPGPLDLTNFPLTPGKSPSKPSWWGFRWKEQIPPGYPRTARTSGDLGSARVAVDVYSHTQNLGPAFVKTMHNLAHGESGETVGLPAHIFDARCETAGHGVDVRKRCVFETPGRPPGKSLITATGTFGWNSPAWQLLQPGKFTWEATPAEEVGLPIRYYANLWRQLKGAGATDRDAARGIRLWHNGVGYYQPYWIQGQRIGFPQAWATVVDPVRQSRIDTHLRKDGLAGLAGLVGVRTLGLGYFPAGGVPPVSVQGLAAKRARRAASMMRAAA